MFNLTKLSALLCLLMVSPYTLAGSVGSATITQYFTYNTANLLGGDGSVFVYVSKPITGGPVCATQTTRFVINAATNVGKAAIAAVINAHNSGKLINIGGNNTCNLWADTESIQNITVLPY